MASIADKFKANVLVKLPKTHVEKSKINIGWSFTTAEISLIAVLY